MQRAAVKLGILEEARSLGRIWRCSVPNKVHLAPHTTATESHLYNKSSRDDDPSSTKETLSDSQNQDQGKVSEEEEEEEEGEQQEYKNPLTGEIGGPKGPEPTRFGDWEKGGRCSDF
ncbi:hypothetical protein L7F22_067296 [Adiantum nelumboides]|nr:hypothetical protein [Adiantum nelumboides]